MRRRFLPTTLLSLAAATLAASGCDKPSRQTDPAVIPVSAPAADATPEGVKVYKGRIKDVRPAWDLLILTVGQGKEARDLRFDIGEARIVGWRRWEGAGSEHRRPGPRADDG
jgi:hypothetical protein